jgi:polysaccharide deacetylase family protein (PEP-CTERM system associated)
LGNGMLLGEHDRLGSVNTTEDRPQPQSGVNAHFFTVDVEEHFQVAVFDGVVSRDQWSTHPSRVEGNTARLLELLASHSATATFFVLGWVAEKYPGLARTIAEAGHEVASHGYSHRRVTQLTPEEFRHDVVLAKDIIEQACGRPIRGFRAPNFSILPGMEWALEVLLQSGHVYDSSYFPIRRAGYGNPDSPPIPHVVDTPSGYMIELPMATTTLANVRVPAAGGAYLRHFPYAMIRRAFLEHDASGLPAMFYIHPWETDVDQPRIRASLLATWRHYGGLRKTMPRLQRLLSEFRFCSIEARLPDISGQADTEGLIRALH